MTPLPQPIAPQLRNLFSEASPDEFNNILKVFTGKVKPEDVTLFLRDKKYLDYPLYERKLISICALAGEQGINTKYKAGKPYITFIKRASPHIATLVYFHPSNRFIVNSPTNLM